jgi:hypothetical protein
MGANVPPTHSDVQTERSASPPANPDSRRRHSQFIVMVGLFVTFGGLFGYALQAPTEPSTLTSIVPWLAVGFLSAWTGGILAGNSLVEPPPGIRPALFGQSTLAGIATLAGGLSALVVILRVGPWSSPSASTPAELVIATVAAAMVWAGGFLMGRSMRRFVLRRRTRPSP